MENLIIVGSGPAGLTAAIYTGRANLKPLIIEGRAPGGQLMGTTLVENWPGYKQIMGPALMAQMREHAAACGARFLSDEATKIEIVKGSSKQEEVDRAHPESSTSSDLKAFDTQMTVEGFTPEAPRRIEGSKRASDSFSIATSKNGTLHASAIIVASGASPRKLKVPGEETYWGKGVTTCAVCDGALYADKPVVIVGGGDTAMEEALFLNKYTDDITIIQLLDKLTASYAMQQPVLANKKIKILYQAAISEIKGDADHAREVVITDQQTKAQTTLKADGIFIAIGQIPNTQFLKGIVDLDQHGYVQCHEAQTERFSMLTATSVPGIFAAGDVSDPRYRQAVSAAGSGCMAALDVERYLKKIESV